MYAFFYPGSGIIYVGDLINAKTLIASIDFSSNGQLKALKWRPASTEFVISGVN
jgi:hypothetical protein